MRTLVTTLPAMFLTLALAAPAAAQDRATLPAPEVRYEFHDHDVDGDRHGTDQARVWIRAGALRQSLIRPRVHFVPELMKSVETL